MVKYLRWKSEFKAVKTVCCLATFCISIHVASYSCIYTHIVYNFVCINISFSSLDWLCRYQSHFCSASSNLPSFHSQLITSQAVILNYVTQKRTYFHNREKSWKQEQRKGKLQLSNMRFKQPWATRKVLLKIHADDHVLLSSSS